MAECGGFAWLKRPSAHKQRRLIGGHEAVNDILLNGCNGFLIFVALTGAIPDDDKRRGVAYY